MGVRLWSDEPSGIDLLAFNAVAQTLIEAVLDDSLDPVALGLSGPWGSGKSTVLRLMADALELWREDNSDKRVLVVRSEAWRYDPSAGAKVTLISEVLSALDAELTRVGEAVEDAKSLLRRLAKRVNWIKALKIATKTSITLQLPSLDDVLGLVNEQPEDGEPESRTLDEFRAEFEALLGDASLSHVKRVVVLVDDLDRCLPETVVDTLETMRLFLSVPKMSFVIAADEERVAEAIRERYPTHTKEDDPEEPAKLYLHKIVQTTLRLPALSRFDTEAFLLLLLVQNRPDHALTTEQFNQILGSCTELRLTSGLLDSLAVPAGVNMDDELQFAARLTPMLYEKLQGSPRRVKRFLNDLNVRASIAERRGIELDLPVVAKLMMLEQLMPDDFRKLLRWLAEGTLRDKLTELEKAATRGGEQTQAPAAPEAVVAGAASVEPVVESPDPSSPAGDSPADQFSAGLIRWARLPPMLKESDLSPYLHLAASFSGESLIDSGLPEGLRDIASNLLSESRVTQKSVSASDLASLPMGEVESLIQHLGRMGRDRPNSLLQAVNGILRVAEATNANDAAETALHTIPTRDIKAPIVLLFGPSQSATFRSLLDRWADETDEQPVRNAVANLLTPKAAN